MNAGAVPTRKVAALVVVVPAVLVNTARYWLPSSPAAAVNVYVVLVAPLMLAKLAPPLVDRCHCTVGAGTPEPDALNVTEVPG